MGLPFWEMPDHLIVGGKRYPIRTDFRVGIRVRQMIWDPYYAAHPAALLDGIRHLLFAGDAVAADDAALLCAVVWYLLDGRVEPERIMARLSGDAGSDLARKLCAGKEDGDPVFSYLWDTPALYAAFLQAYRVDLLCADMHLWQFDALFASLPDDCALSRTMALRALPLQSVEDGDARAALAAGKLAHRIPDADALHRISLCALQDLPSAHGSFANQDER